MRRDEINFNFDVLCFVLPAFVVDVNVCVRCVRSRVTMSLAWDSITLLHGIEWVANMEETEIDLTVWGFTSKC